MRTRTSRRQILALLDEYDIGYVKWDHNRDLIEAGTQTDEGRPGVHAQTLAFYRLLDEIREAHPGLEIESCSSGGARVDLAVLERTDRVWVSDNIDPHDRQRMLRWTGQLLPPEYLGSHIASGRSHATGRIHDLGFRAGTALFGHLGIEWDLAQASDQEMAELRAWIAFYKEHRRFLLHRRPGADGRGGGQRPPARGGRPRPVPCAVRLRARRQPLSRPRAAAAFPRPRPGAGLPGAAGVRRLRAVRAAGAAVVGSAGRAGPAALAGPVA